MSESATDALVVIVVCMCVQHACVACGSKCSHFEEDLVWHMNAECRNVTANHGCKAKKKKTTTTNNNSQHVTAIEAAQPGTRPLVEARQGYFACALVDSRVPHDFAIKCN